MKISDFVIKTFVDLGIESAFSVTGGASMHLNDSAGENRKLQVLYMHNEQSCSMAAEGYARIARKPGLVIVTAGPGAINAFNGVFGAFTDSIPMIVISGQAKKNTQRSHFGLNELRQLGDQEAPILNMVSKITKKTYEVTAEMNGEEVAELIVDAYSVATLGRPGPVWIEIPVDVQALQVDFESVQLKSIYSPDFSSPKIEELLKSMLAQLSTSKRPVLLLGSGVKISNTEKQAILFAELLGIPVLTAWSHDVIGTDHPLFFGRPGTIGTRPGNMILQNSDFLLVLGSRLNIRQISYNYEAFAPNAFKVQVDIDAEEFKKPFPKIDICIPIDLRSFFQILDQFLPSQQVTNLKSKWINWCKMVREKYSLKESDYPVKTDSINAYHLIPEIIRQAPENAILVCGDATACIVPFQTAHLKVGMNMFSNSGCASMGYDLPAAIGASIAAPERPIICFAGDGSIMMNIQELQTFSDLSTNFTLIILENGGYLSIKQTQSNFFVNHHGSTTDSGLSFPDFAKICTAFGLQTIVLDPKNWRDEIKKYSLSISKKVLIAHLDREQEIEPRIKSRIVNNVIQTSQLDDMYPHLDPEILLELRKSAQF